MRPPGGASIRCGVGLAVDVSQLPRRPAGRLAGFGRTAASAPIVGQAPVVDQEGDVLVDLGRRGLLDDQQAAKPALQRLGAAAEHAGPDQEGAGIGRREAVS